MRGQRLNRIYLFIYLFINYNTIINYILIIYELSNFKHELGVVSQDQNRNQGSYANSVAHYPLD